MQRRLREAAFLLLAPVAVYLLLCLITYSTDDPGWNHAAAHAQPVQNLGGAIGAWIADVAFSLFGFLAYAFPLLLFTVGLALFRVPGKDQKSSLEPTLRLIGGVAFKHRGARAVSFFFVLAATIKVFLFDASELTGLWRVLSFLLMGLSFLGISWAYARFVFGIGTRKEEPPAPPSAPPVESPAPQS